MAAKSLSSTSCKLVYITSLDSFMREELKEEAEGKVLDLLLNGKMKVFLVLTPISLSPALSYVHYCLMAFSQRASTASVLHNKSISHDINCIMDSFA